MSAFRRLERWIEQSQREGRPDDAPQVTILARGGGSLEDLWSFNDERVVRAVVAHSVPVVCGVGHEVDVTLADFAADVRAPTPSAAAELVVPDRSEWEKAFRRASERIASAAGGHLATLRRDLDAERRALARLDPLAQLAASRERVGLLLDRGVRAVDVALGRRRVALDAAAAALPQLATARTRASAIRPRRGGGRPRRPRSAADARTRLRDRAADGRRGDRPRPWRGAARHAAEASRRRGRDRGYGRPTRVTELIVFFALVAVVAVVGIRLGMLVAPRLTRWTERDEQDEDEPIEEPRDDGPG